MNSKHSQSAYPSLVLLAHLILSLLMTHPARAEEAPYSQQITIRALRANGSGCPLGSASSTLAPDSKSFSLLFDRFSAMASTREIITDKKICDVDVTLSIPSGWSFALFSADYRGFADVESGSIAYHQVVYTFDRSISTGTSSTSNSYNPYDYSTSSRRGTLPATPARKQYSFNLKDFRGPFTGEYSIHNELPMQTVAWSPCDGTSDKTLRISIGLLSRVLNTRVFSESQITLDSVDGALDQKFGLKWKRCENGSGGNTHRPNPPIPTPTTHNYPSVAVYRLTNGVDNLFTTSQEEGLRMGYTGENTPVFYLFSGQIRIPGISMAPLYRCVNPFLRSHFLSRDARCEGGRAEGILGYVSTYSAPGLMALARYTNLNNSADRVSCTTQSSADRGFYLFDLFQGYVPNK